MSLGEDKEVLIVIPDPLKEDDGNYIFYVDGTFKQEHADRISFWKYEGELFHIMHESNPDWVTLTPEMENQTPTNKFIADELRLAITMREILNASVDQPAESAALNPVK